MKLPEGWMFSKLKISDHANSLLNLAETKLYEVGLEPPCFFFIFVNFKSRALSRKPSNDRVMPHTEVHARAQVSSGNITVLSHVKLNFERFVIPLTKRVRGPYCKLQTECAGHKSKGKTRIRNLQNGPRKRG